MLLHHLIVSSNSLSSSNFSWLLGFTLSFLLLLYTPFIFHLHSSTVPSDTKDLLTYYCHMIWEPSVNPLTDPTPYTLYSCQNHIDLALVKLLSVHFFMCISGYIYTEKNAFTILIPADGTYATEILSFW